MNEQIRDRRRAGRLSCQIPVLLHSGARSFQTATVDLSRVGTLVRIPLEVIGIEPEVPLAQIGRKATDLLGELVRADLHYEVLGTLISHSARPVRLARGTPSEPGASWLEVGLDFTEPITEMEAQLLGVDLPALRDDAPATWIPEPTVATGPGGEPSITLVMCNEHDTLVPPLRLMPMHVDRDGIRADLGRISDLPVLPDERGAGSVLAVLAETFGGEPLSVVLVDSEPVWSGHVRFSAVEVCPYEHTVRVQLDFAQVLTERVVRRLGVA